MCVENYLFISCKLISDQRIFTTGRSACRAVIDDGMIPFSAAADVVIDFLLRFAQLSFDLQCFWLDRTTPKLSLPLGRSGPRPIHDSLGSSESASSNRHLNRFSRFYRARERDRRDRQTDRQTDHGLMMIDYMNLTTSVTRSRVVTGSRYVFRDATYRIQTRNFHSHINVGDRKSDIVSAINQGATIVYVVPVGV